jgi:hypothetical protein
MNAGAGVVDYQSPDPAVGHQHVAATPKYAVRKPFTLSARHDRDEVVDATRPNVPIRCTAEPKRCMPTQRHIPFDSGNSGELRLVWRSICRVGQGAQIVPKAVTCQSVISRFAHNAE